VEELAARLVGPLVGVRTKEVALCLEQVSRECGTAVGTGSASEILKDGMRVRIDFDRGDIEILV
jgi:phosphohistidine swiveling domain-containing protein